MKDLADKVAVITGGAGGLGLALARRFAREGMKLVLADVDNAALERAAAGLKASGASVMTQRTDVSKGTDIEALAQTTTAAFGAVHLVINNAGIGTVGVTWESSEADWQWTLGVNLWGVIHGVRVFTPIMLKQDTEGHIVNVASVAGLISPPGMGVYNVSKHAVVALTETLHHDLTVAQSKLKCSVLCPAYFPSGIADSERTRPSALVNEGRKSATQQQLESTLRKAVHSGKITADEIADRVCAAVREERFYILPHERIKPAIEARMRDILDEAAPRDPLRLR